MSRVSPGPRARVSVAFAPSHITGIFSPDLSPRDPRARGSVGAGIVLEVGVRATAVLRPGSARRVVVRSRERAELPISRETADRLLGDRRAGLTVDLEHALPIGQGFGASAAGALATALAVAPLLGVRRPRAIATAHLADLFLGGGLGGVASILGGGLELRTRTGIPPWGRVLHTPFPYPVLVSVVGVELPSPRLLGNSRFLDRVRAAAESGLRELGGRPDPRRFLDASEAFTDALAIASPVVRRTIRALRRAGGRTAQTMFGSSVFTVPTTPSARRSVLREIERRGLYAVELRAGRAGAGRRPLPRGDRARESLLLRGRVAAPP